MNTPNRALLFSLFVFAASLSRGGTIIWTNTAGGDWNNAVNWSPNLVPTSADDAEITEPGTYAVVLDVSPTVSILTVGSSSGIQTLTINGLSLNVIGSATFNSLGNLNFNGGNLLGTGTYTLIGSNYWSSGSWGNSGLITVATSGTLVIDTTADHNLPGTSWTNQGTIIHTGGRVRGGNTILNNSGTWLEETDNVINADFGASVQFNNSGTYTKTNSAGTSSFANNAILFNSGLVDAESGIIDITDNGGSSTGAFFAAAGATCDFTADFAFGNGTLFEGPGTNIIDCGGDTATFYGLFTATNMLYWNSGFINGTPTNAAGSTLAIVSANDHNIPNATLNNLGTIIRTGGRVRGGNTVIENDALWLDETDNVINADYGGAGLLFTNAGTFRKTAGSGATTFINNGILRNSGLVDAESGTILISDNGGSSTGVFYAAAGATNDFIADFTFGIGALFEGPGINIIDCGGNTVTFDGAFSATNLLYWNSGLINGPITNAPGSTLAIVSANDHNMPNASLNNLGTVIRTGGRVRGGNTIIQNNALWLDETDNVINGDYGASGLAFMNAGTFRKTAGSGATTFINNGILLNSGLVDTESGSVVVADNGGSSTGVFYAAAGATNDFIADYTFASGTLFEGSGTNILDCGGNTIIFNGLFSATNLLYWNSGLLAGTATNAVGSTLAITSANDHNMPNASLNNLGLVLHNGGRVRGGNTLIQNTGLWLEETDNVINGDYGASGLTLVNTGTFRKIGTTGTTTFENEGFLINSNLVDVESGLLEMSTSGGQNYGGSFYADTSGAIDFNNTYTFNNGSQFPGPGPVTLNGAMTFTGTFNSTNLQWVSGQLEGNGTNILGSVFTIASASDHNMPDANLNNNGTVLHTGGRVRGGDTTIANAGLWLEQSDNAINGDYGGTGLAFVNTGTFRKTNSPGTATFLNGGFLINSNLVDVESGLLEMNTSGGQNYARLFAGLGGAIDFDNAYTFNDGSQFPGPGPVTLNGAMAFTGRFAAANLQWVSGTLTGSGTNVFGSTFAIVGASDHNMPNAALYNLGTIVHTGGRIQGGGTTIGNNGVWLDETDNVINGAYGGTGVQFLNGGLFDKTNSTGTSAFISGAAFVNNGTLEVESGIVAMNSGYTHNNATMNFGLASATTYGKVTLSGAVALNGTLAVNLLGAYAPALGDTFTVLTDLSEGGNFNNLNLSLLPPSERWQVTYNPSSVVLTVVGPGANSSQIFGSVKDAPTHGVANLTVFAFTGSNPTYTYLSTTTDANGNYSLPVDNETWTVGVENLPAAGYNAVPNQSVTISGASQEVDFNVQVIGATTPLATTTAAGSLLPTSATLNGTVNPNGEAVSVYYEYGRTMSYGSFTSTNTLSTILNTTQSSPAPIAGLLPGVGYHFQIVAVNTLGTSLGGDLAFTTPGAPPSVVTTAATNISSTNATVTGTVNPNGLPTSYYFEYGKDANYGSFTPTNVVPAGNSVLTETNEITNLAPATVYHFQLVAVNSAGTIVGGDLTWTNDNAAPVVTTLAATPIGTTTATVNGSINPNGLDTAWYFEYGTDLTYGSSTPTNTVPAGNTIQAVDSALTDLTPDVVYHFQLVGSNALGLVLGGDLTFTNQPIPATIQCPADFLVTAAPLTCSQMIPFAAVAFGVPTPTVTYQIGATIITSPYEFPVGTNIVTCTASNVGGEQSCSFKVVVVENAPPIAGPNQMGTFEGTAASVDVVKMLARDSAPNGGTLSIIGVQALTPGGGGVSLAGGKITYNPEGGFIGSDTLTYILSDGCGTAPGTIAVTVLSTNLPARNTVSITMSPGGPTLVFAGVPGAKYVVEWAPLINGPWTALNATPITAAANGLVQTTDTFVGSGRFYRTRYVSGP